MKSSALIIVLFLAVQACSEQEVTTGTKPDVGESLDLRTVADGSSTPLDVAVRHDPDADTRDSVREIQIARSEFELSSRCEETRDLAAASSAEFEVPTRPLGEPLPTRSSLVTSLGEPLPVVHAITAAPSHQPGRGQSVDMWAKSGDDVSVHVVFGFPRKTGLDTFRFNLVAMVDYKPVEAKYIRWDDERTNALTSTDAKGVRYRMTRDVELVEVVLPANTFPESRAYEVSIAFEVTNLASSRSMGAQRRLMLYYGGFERAQAPCVPEVLGVSAQAHEKHHWGYFLADDGVFLAYDGMPEDSDTQKRIAPGTTLNFLATVFRQSHVHTPLILQPVLNGQPVGDPRLVSYGARGGGFPQTVDARIAFDLTMPDEPGEYEVIAMTWPYAYEFARTPEGEVNKAVQISTGFDNSNGLRLIVDDSL